MAQPVLSGHLGRIWAINLPNVIQEVGSDNLDVLSVRSFL